MTGASLWNQFADVDRAADPGALLELLEAFSSLDPVREGKRRSLELLDVRPGQRLLDLGCGLGDDAATMARLVGREGEAVGIDASSAAITAARARHRGEAVRFEVADAAELPYGDRSFDRCRSDRVLQHLSDPERALAELVRVTKPGGRMVISESSFALRTEAPLDPEITATIFAVPHGSPDRRGWVGHFLPISLRRVGLRDVGYKSDVGVAPGESLLDSRFRVADTLDDLTRSGALDRAVARRWYEEFRAACATNDLEIQVRLHHFIAWVPPEPDPIRERVR